MENLRKTLIPVTFDALVMRDIMRIDPSVIKNFIRFITRDSSRVAKVVNDNLAALRKEHVEASLLQTRKIEQLREQINAFNPFCKS